MTSFEPVIGLEIHVELATKTKLFCGCVNGFGGSPNTQVCPVCLGLPGVLPVVNERAIELLLRAALAFGCEIPQRSKFDRKNYFYADMPKNYQISQYDLPFSVRGGIKISADKSVSEEKTVGITRIHLEEDTGKSIHVAPKDPSENAGATIVGGRIGYSAYTLLDYNRAGVPLIEIVSEPDMRSPKEAVEFLQKLRLTLQVLEVSDCKMEEGRMRCDANVSIRPQGTKELGTKIEVKNMNSFRSVREALTFEIERQTNALAHGERLIQETRAWDESKKVTFSMRSKEEAHDYRYFPEPDLSPFLIEKEWHNRIGQSLPELPEARLIRYQEHLGLSLDEAEFLVGNPSITKFFDQAVSLRNLPRDICNWMRGDVSKYLNEKNIEITETRLTPGALVELIALIEKGTVSGKIAKEILPEMMSSGKTAQALIDAQGLTQISDDASLLAVVNEVVQDPANSNAIGEYRAGKEKAFGFLIGAIMKKTKGKANPQKVGDILKESLKTLVN